MAAMVTTIAAMTYTHGAAPSIRRAGSVGSPVSAATPTRTTTTGGSRRRASRPSTRGGGVRPARRTVVPRTTTARVPRTPTAGAPGGVVATTSVATGTGPAGPGTTR